MQRRHDFPAIAVHDGGYERTFGIARLASGAFDFESQFIAVDSADLNIYGSDGRAKIYHVTPDPASGFIEVPSIAGADTGLSTPSGLAVRIPYSVGARARAALLLL